MMNDIEVTGDLILDNNLAQLPRESTTYSNPVQGASRNQHLGGAWYLARMVDSACSDLDNYKRRPLPNLDQVKQICARAHTIWAIYPKQQGEKKKSVWRIREFLGCQKSEATQIIETANSPILNPKLIVIDDANLGFRENPHLWPAAINDLSHDQDLQIILRHSPSLAQGPLWEHLIEHFADRLTVVISLNSLRERHAIISKAMSWDQTIEDLIKEFRLGQSANDLGGAKNVIILIPGGGVAHFARSVETNRPELQHLAFDPEHMEDDWMPVYPGTTFGATTILTAAMVRHLADPDSYPFFIAASRALTAIRENHIIGAGSYDFRNSDQPFKGFDTDSAQAEIEAIFHPEEGVDNSQPQPLFAEKMYAAVLIKPERYGLYHPHRDERACLTPAPSQSECSIDLLQNVTGDSKSVLSAKAFEIVRNGPKVALRSVPKAKYGNFTTVDREEIERINEIRSLIEVYCNNPADRKPLSLAVFGPPGSGKSFAIKQLARQLFPDNRSELEFNLSQFSDLHELKKAFHQVHNVTVRGEIPLVFWDEFDADKLKWLKSFLAPMQDAVFRDAGIEHPFGKAIFIFAGGTCKRFEDFKQSGDLESSKGEPSFKDLKGPDFISRLRGYLNVKGPNQIQNDADECIEKCPQVYLIRRAMLLRSLLERNAPEIIDPATGKASISSGTLNAFIHVERYLHGARSMEAILTMGTLSGKDYFGPDSLPSEHLLNLHVSSNFMEEIMIGEQCQMPVDVLGKLAEAGYNGWREATGKQEATNYDLQSHEEQQSSRFPVPQRIIALAEEGYSPRRVWGEFPEDQRINLDDKKQKLSDEEKNLLSNLVVKEHNIWLRSHLIDGWEDTHKSDKKLRKVRLHQDIKQFNQLSLAQQKINEAIISRTVEALQDTGFVLQKTEDHL